MRSHNRIGWLAPALAAALAAGAVGTALAENCNGFPEGAIINNGTVQLGINCQGHLNYEYPGDPLGIGYMGLRYMPTGAASTEPGCLCEGWGAADATTLATGHADRANGSPVNMTVTSFVVTATTAVSTVEIGSTYRVTHDYHPSPDTPFLYEVVVSITNISASPVDVLYRRVMDWDVYPTPFAEFVTIDNGSAVDLFRTDTNGFNIPDPFSFSSYMPGPVTDSGPADHGALFDFDFGTLAPGATKSFRTFYGAAGTEADALTALVTVGAEAFSLGQANVVDGPTLGIPNTFMFAFAGIGGTPVFCGNNVVDPGEDCDDGNVIDDDGCDSNCRVTGCGNDIQTSGEACDGIDDAACPGQCNDSCQCDACGSDAECDDGNPCTTDTCEPTVSGAACVHTNNTDPCDDGNACTTTDQCGGGTCSGVAVDCNDDNLCTDDTCVAAGDDFACSNTLNGACAPGCGDEVVGAGETCDPPDLSVDPVTGQTVCRLDCTACGDGVVQGGAGETCDDGNTTSGCDPARPLRPLDACLNTCAMPICEDPARIRFHKDGDELRMHGQLTTADGRSLDLASNEFMLRITREGQVIFESRVGADLIQANGSRFRYRNAEARSSRRGTSLIWAAKRTGGYKMRFVGYGNLRAAAEDMTTHVVIGAEEWEVSGRWERTNNGWKLDKETIVHQ